MTKRTVGFHQASSWNFFNILQKMNQSLIFILLFAFSLATKPIPGLDRLGLGFDAFTGASKMFNVVEYSYTNSTTVVYSNETYLVPNSVTFLASPAETLTVQLFEDSTSFANFLSARVGISGSFPAAFSASASVVAVEKQLVNASHYFGYTEMQVSEFSLGLPDPTFLELSPLFLSMVATLPKNYSSEAYFELFQQFGTHYIGSALYGGRATMQTFVTTEYVGQQSVISVQEQMSSQFTSFQEGAGLSSNSSSSFYLQNSISQVYFYGGNPLLANQQKDYQGWKDSIQSAPIQVTFLLYELTNLIEDSVISQNVHRGIVEYIAGNFSSCMFS